MLSETEVESFITDGFVPIRSAFSSDLARRGRERLWEASGCDPDDPTTWTAPVIRLNQFADPPFRAAANTPALHEAFDQLVGRDRWKARGGLGTFPIRFPSTADPGDAGWHLDASFADADGQGRVNLRSRGRALLMLFLFSDVSESDAPTIIRTGSHLDVPALLRGTGDEGAEWLALCGEAVPASAHRREALATGRAGDVFLCHPFLVHRAQPHHGTTPRFMAQPPLELAGELDLSTTDPTPVEAPIMTALAAVQD